MSCFVPPTLQDSDSLTAHTQEHALTSSVLYEGWVLKKRRKKMQGFARRYFTLYSEGTLKYSFGPGKPIRDQMSLTRAAISTSPGRKDIHVDSATATFHLKCLTMDDFETWMEFFRKFIRFANDARRSASVKLTTQQGFLPVSKLGGLIDEMGQTIAELDRSIVTIAQDHTSRMHQKKPDKNKDHPKDAVLGLFRKVPHATPTEEPPEYVGMVDSASMGALPASIRHATAVLNTLKTQHASLVTSLQQFSRIEPAYYLRSSPLPMTVEENSMALPVLPSLKHSRQNSFTTTSESINEWYDAPDGPEEFVVHMDEQEPVELVASSDNRSSCRSEAFSCGDTDTEDDFANNQDQKGQEGQVQANPSQVVRRSELPVIAANDEGSLFAILKNNVGKDLSTVAFPVSFNEPLTLLQRAAEEVEYCELLDKAAQSNDRTMRICYVAAFAVSAYAHTCHRSGRKGFNPMLGETFEDIRMNFIAEKVRHNPLEIAYHASGGGWKLTATSCGRTKFWGKSLEIIPLGTTHLKIGESHYTWKKPSSFIRNLVVGTKYLEHCGKLTIEDISDGTRAVLEFKQNGYWGAANVVSGVVYSNDSKTAYQLDGKWDEQLSQSLNSSQYRVLWRINPFSKNAQQFYGFTNFAMTLNEITSDVIGRLPPTDSRYRADVRALEEGDLDYAEEEKQRVEELQRQRRRRGEDRKPRWFKQDGEEWVYKGGYWEARANGWQSEHIEPLW
ncbi:hypothetical protein AX15_001154 [Amanita polypyramis BW_CC]|nr:hypothetical protein AX15_001154 [Amanita polypyramis BW_CC]